MHTKSLEYFIGTVSTLPENISVVSIVVMNESVVTGHRNEPSIVSPSDGIISEYVDYYDESYYYDEYETFYLKVFPFEIISLGIVRPILALLTALANAFVVGFFLSKKNRGQATNLLFVSIAFSDTMTGLLLLPNSFHVYLGKNDQLSREWCTIYMVLRLYFSRVFHTVSVWQTVMLGIQRYMCVCHPFITGRVCTFRKTFAFIAIMYCLAIVLHLYHILDDKVGEMPPRCQWLVKNPCTGMCVYLWFCVLLQHLLPCLVLLCLTVKTLRGLHKANKRASSMYSFGHKRFSRDRIITITTSLVVIVFLVPELPHGIYKLVLAVYAQRRDELGLQSDTETNHIIVCVYELALLVSFHANFWIYCSIMQDFRQAFCKFITCGVARGGIVRLRTFSGSVSSRKNSENTKVSQTSILHSRQIILSQTTSVPSTGPDAILLSVPLSPIKGEPCNAVENSREQFEEDPNDDVFV